MMELLELYRIAEDQGIVVDCFELAKRESLSVMDRDGECFIAIDPNKLESAQDETLKLAHEMGHCCTGSFYNRWAARDVRQKHENRADKWAIEHLVPKAEFDEAVDAGFNEVWSLSQYFDVSEDFMRKAVCWYTRGNLAVEAYP